MLTRVPGTWKEGLQRGERPESPSGNYKKPTLIDDNVCDKGQDFGVGILPKGEL